MRPLVARARRARPPRSHVDRDPRRGFSLLELAFVLLVTTILAGLAQTSFKRQAMRARRAEAISGLGAIRLSEEAYRASVGSYGDSFDEIGFSLDGGERLDAHTVRGRAYTFTVRALPFDGNPRGNFQALAVADLDPSDAMLDILTIENHLTLQP